MNEGRIWELRRCYHRSICSGVLVRNQEGIPNNADKGSRSSIKIGKRIIDEIGMEVPSGSLSGQTAGSRFERATKSFLHRAFNFLHHLRPGEWEFSMGGKISDFEPYRHLQDIQMAIERDRKLRVAFGDYIIKPDIVLSRKPVGDDKVNEEDTLLSDEEVASYTPLRRHNSEKNILHASISCKWTIRSDRSQNARTEGLNLMRNRKGATPHIAVVVGEPLPTRIASLALGTGDIDCVYHFALHELRRSVEDGELDMLNTMVDGKRLRDISDLPFDLAI